MEIVGVKVVGEIETVGTAEGVNVVGVKLATSVGLKLGVIVGMILEEVVGKAVVGLVDGFAVGF